MREKNINVREKYQLVASCTHLGIHARTRDYAHVEWGLNPKPRYVPRPGVKHTTF